MRVLNQGTSLGACEVAKPHKHHKNNTCDTSPSATIGLPAICSTASCALLQEAHSALPTSESSGGESFATFLKEGIFPRHCPPRPMDVSVCADSLQGDSFHTHPPRLLVRSIGINPRLEEHCPSKVHSAIDIADRRTPAWMYLCRMCLLGKDTNPPLSPVTGHFGPARTHILHSAAMHRLLSQNGVCVAVN